MTSFWKATSWSRQRLKTKEASARKERTARPPKRFHPDPDDPEWEARRKRSRRRMLKPYRSGQKV